MSHIVTFYSYKGGVGRTMAMANVAVLLALRGLKVLVVDWDLEAPGLERYFGYFTVNPPKDGGLLALLQQQKRGSRGHYIPHLARVSGEVGSRPIHLDLLPSGRETYREYLPVLEGFDWENYFEEGGGDFIEELRSQWRRDYDITLIDSRTGLSDTGGICTIQLPDAVVALFTANYQSLYGVRDTMELVLSARERLAYDRMHLPVLPIPARYSQDMETPEATEWLGRIAEVLGPFYQDWLPAGVSPRQMSQDLRIPQVDAFGFGEKLATVEQELPTGHSLAAVYGRIADLLMRPLTDTDAITALSAKARPTQQTGKRPSRTKVRATRKVRERTRAGYEFDLFISHATNSVQIEWLDTFIKRLMPLCESRLGRKINVFFDHSEVRVGEAWSGAIANGLLKSRLLLAIVTPKYVESPWCRGQWATFEQREMSASTRHPLIVPMLLRRLENTPEWMTERQFLDLTDLPTSPAAMRKADVEWRLATLADAIVASLRSAPAFDSGWSVTDLSAAAAAQSVSPMPLAEAAPPSLTATGMATLLAADPSAETQARASRLLKELSAEKDFPGAIQVGRALHAHAKPHTDDTLLYAHALLETGAAGESKTLLSRLIKQSKINRAEKVRAQALLAQATKQYYLSVREGKSATARRALKDAINAHHRAYRAAPEAGVAVDLLALRATARRLKILRTSPLADRQIAQDHLRRLATIPASIRDTSHEQLVAELNLAQGRWEAFEKHLHAFLAHPDLTAVDLNRVLSQLTGMWDLEAVDARGAGLVSALKARVLATAGGAVSLPPLDSGEVAGRARKPALERVLGESGIKTLQWFQIGLERARSVGAVINPAGERVATCFLVTARDIGIPIDGIVAITSAHALGDLTTVSGFTLEFDESGSTLRTAAILLHSPPHEFDTVVLQLRDTPPLHALPIAKSLPSLDEPHRVYLIGYARERGLAASLLDNELLDYSLTSRAPSAVRVHYRAATDAGSSGSPVFDENWDVIAIHHMRGPSLPRLNGKPGTYAAGEGIGVLSIAQAIQAKRVK